jgi:hypothetical protein
MSHLLFLTESGPATAAGHAGRARDQAVVSVNPRMRAGLMAALHLIRVESPAGPRPLASRGEPAGQGLWPPAWGLSRRALARGMIAALDPKTAALLHVAVLVAIGSPAVCLEWSTGRARWRRAPARTRSLICCRRSLR